MSKHTEQIALWPIGRQDFSATFDAEHTTSDAAPFCSAASTTDSAWPSGWPRSCTILATRP